ncbi:MAG: CoB--CoM heterodisulfide reductase iron-sulfur subunit A family protein [Desulfobacteraceae bacterium]|nr:CoB--CoM heterodisulfide reductase iron-sulfur subunit A family protein [Desulfobacteraceae bacterium]
MRIGVYFCRCGGIISEKIREEAVRAGLAAVAADLHVAAFDFLCSEEGKGFLAQDLREHGVERVVIGACSPREHESTFRRVLTGAGLNPFLLQMANVREQIAWVTDGEGEATAKAVRYLRAAVRRVSLHQPLLKKEIAVCPEVLVIGGGPAGLKAALTIAQAGRKAIVVEKSPIIGGLPVRYEELFPTLECGPCMLEPVLDEVLHGEAAANIELLTLAEVTGLKGFYGNFTATIRRRPRYVDGTACIGCLQCAEACPASAANPFNYGLSERKAISVPFDGALPNVPFIEPGLCLHLSGEECRACREACPLEGTIRLDEGEELLELQAGAVVVATGAGLYDSRAIPGLGHGILPGVHTAAEFERLLAANGPTGGELAIGAGEGPGTVAIVHCVGSLDPAHREYCSGICCQVAFKFNQLIRKKVPGTRIVHLFREIVVAGKEDSFLYHQARQDEDTVFCRYPEIGALGIRLEDGRMVIEIRHQGGTETIAADLVVLCPAVVPAEGSGELASLLETPLDRWGFFEEMHGRVDPVQSKVKGIYLAGSCQGPMDIRQAMGQGLAAAGAILSRLVPGRRLELPPITAVVAADRCSGCGVCQGLCPFKAMTFDPERRVAAVSEVLCQGCGTCVAACPAGAITGNHFTDAAITAEIEALLS